jgi:CBS domain-containing protein
VKVRDVMEKDITVLKPTDTLRAAAEQLAECGIGGMPVCDTSGALQGVLTEYDILEAMKTQHKTLKMLMPPQISFGISFVEVLEEREAAKAFAEIGDRPVAEVMTKDVAAVGADETVERAIQLMVKRKVHRLPVVDRGKVVGVLTRGDILKGFFRSLPE